MVYFTYVQELVRMVSKRGSDVFAASTFSWIVKGTWSMLLCDHGPIHLISNHSVYRNRKVLL